MRVQSTRVAQPPRMSHTVGFHSSPADLRRQLDPLVAAALERGELVAVAVRPSTMESLHDAFGNAPGLVGLVTPEGPDGGSGQTLAARRARQLRELISDGSPVTVVTEHWNRYDGADGGFWTELDAATNVAMAGLPIDLTCFFPEMPLHLEILDGARRNHPFLLVDGVRQGNPGFRAPRDVLAERPAPAPVLLGPPEEHLVFGTWDLHRVRDTVQRMLLGAGYGRDRADDVVLAVNEIATNAVEHGGGEHADLGVWTPSDGFVFEVHDDGVLRDPLPGLRAPHPSDPRGRGVWIARQLCDSLHVWHGPRGTHVRMRAAP